MSATARVVDVQHNLSADLKIKETSGISSEELDLPGHLGTGEEHKFNTVTVTTKTAIGVDDPNEFDALDNGDNCSGLSRGSEYDRARICQTLEVDNFQRGRNEKTGFGDNELEGNIVVVASGDRAVASWGIKGALRASANLRSTRAESVEVSIDNSNDREVDLVRDSDRCWGGCAHTSRGDDVKLARSARSSRVTGVRSGNVASCRLCRINSNGNS